MLIRGSKDHDDAAPPTLFSLIPLAFWLVPMKFIHSSIQRINPSSNHPSSNRQSLQMQCYHLRMESSAENGDAVNQLVTHRSNHVIEEIL
jgi:hypothetical protein